MCKYYALILIETDVYYYILIIYLMIIVFLLYYSINNYFVHLKSLETENTENHLN